MKSSDLRKRTHLSAVGRPGGPSVARILAERHVRARPVVVGEVGTKDLSDMALVENNDVIQTISPDRADDPFGERISPWAPRRRHDLLDAHRLQPRPKLLTVRPVPIANDVPWRRVPRKNLADLLRHPRCGRVCCNTEVLDAPPFVAQATMKTNRTANVAVGTTKKSVETRQPTWLSRNVRHVCDGGFRCHTMYLDTVASDASIPSCMSSPWMRGAPHNRFS